MKPTPEAAKEALGRLKQDVADCKDPSRGHMMGRLMTEVGEDYVIILAYLLERDNAGWMQEPHK